IYLAFQICKNPIWYYISSSSSSRYSRKQKIKIFSFFKIFQEWLKIFQVCWRILNVPKIAQLFPHCNTFVSLTVSEIPIVRNEKCTTLYNSVFSNVYDRLQNRLKVGNDVKLS